MEPVPQFYQRIEDRMEDTRITAYYKTRPTTEQIVQSKIVCKSALRDKDGKIFIVAVFQLSEIYKFFFVFGAETARSPRRSWKIRTYFIVKDGRSVLDIAARLGAEQIGKIKYHGGKKNFEAFMDRTANPMRGYDPAAPKALPPGGSVERYNRNTARRRAGRTLYLSNE